MRQRRKHEQRALCGGSGVAKLLLLACLMLQAVNAVHLQQKLQTNQKQKWFWSRPQQQLHKGGATRLAQTNEGESIDEAADEAQDDDTAGLSKEELEQIQNEANKEAGLDESGELIDKQDGAKKGKKRKAKSAKAAAEPAESTPAVDADEPTKKEDKKPAAEPEVTSAAEHKESTDKVDKAQQADEPKKETPAQEPVKQNKEEKKAHAAPTPQVVKQDDEHKKKDDAVVKKEVPAAKKAAAPKDLISKKSSDDEDMNVEKEMADINRDAYDMDGYDGVSGNSKQAKHKKNPFDTKFDSVVQEMNQDPMQYQMEQEMQTKQNGTQTTATIAPNNATASAKNATVSVAENKTAQVNQTVTPKSQDRPKNEQLTQHTEDNVDTSPASQSMQGMLAKARQNAQKVMSQQEQEELQRMQASMGNFGPGAGAGAMGTGMENGYRGFKYFKQMMDQNGQHQPMMSEAQQMGAGAAPQFFPSPYTMPQMMEPEFFPEADEQFQEQALQQQQAPTALLQQNTTQMPAEAASMPQMLNQEANPVDGPPQGMSPFDPWNGMAQQPFMMPQGPQDMAEVTGDQSMQGQPLYSQMMQNMVRDEAQADKLQGDIVMQPGMPQQFLAKDEFDRGWEDSAKTGLAVNNGNGQSSTYFSQSGAQATQTKALAIMIEEQKQLEKMQAYNFQQFKQMQKMLIQMQKSQQWSFNNMQGQIDDMEHRVGKSQKAIANMTASAVKNQSAPVVGSKHDEEIYQLAVRSAALDSVAAESYDVNKRFDEMRNLSLNKNSSLAKMDCTNLMTCQNGKNCTEVSFCKLNDTCSLVQRCEKHTCHSKQLCSPYDEKKPEVMIPVKSEQERAAAKSQLKQLRSHLDVTAMFLGQDNVGKILAKLEMDASEKPIPQSQAAQFMSKYQAEVDNFMKEQAAKATPEQKAQDKLDQNEDLYYQ